jgi:ATP-dependent RNA helicase RhlE
MNDFKSLKLAPSLLRALEENQYTTPTPIQAQAIPALLDGKDVVGIAQTGTGKTAAFALPLLDKLERTGARGKPGRPIALVLSPTRELAQQIMDNVRIYGAKLNVRTTVVYGGVPIGRQKEALRRGIDILVATPGRLADLINQRSVSLEDVQTLILDEADRMLDLGFVNEVKRIAAAVRRDRQTVLFSATMPDSIGELANSLLTDPIRVSVAPEATTAERIEQHMMFVEHPNKKTVLAHLLEDSSFERVLIFTRTKHRADQVVKFLSQQRVQVAAIHGNKAQNARQRALNDFKSGRIRALVATDIAARGIDVNDVTHVINFELPDDPDSYVHRIGRTARGSAEGVAISMCSPEEHGKLRDIQKKIRMSIPVSTGHPHEAAPLMERPAEGKSGERNGRKRFSNRSRRSQRNNSPRRKAA